MLILFMGPTASGKTTLLHSFCDVHKSCFSVVRYTTREMRDGEVNGKDYNFIDIKTFNKMFNDGEFVEVEEYSNERFYGTTLISLISTDYDYLCSTITPSGLLKVCSSDIDFGKIFVVYLECSLSTQIIRYVSRKKDFNVSDKLEMCDRLARDEGMFKGIDAIICASKNLYSNSLYSITLSAEKGVYDKLKIIDSFLVGVNK